VERVREFGAVYVALALWRRLGLHTVLREVLAAGREEVPWEAVAVRADDRTLLRAGQ